MKYGIISDIHGNLEALEAVLKALGEVDGYVCLGDLVGYGANPNECCERVRALTDQVLLGNHDAAALGRLDLDWFNDFARAAIEWTMAQVTPENKDWLRSLPERLERLEATLAHGSLRDPWEYVSSTWEARSVFEAMDTDLCFLGHTHVAEFYVQSEGRRCQQFSLIQGGTVALRNGHRYVINCGSVGQPRDGNWQASAGLYDTEARRVQVLRVNYDLATAQRKIQAAGLPAVLSYRLGLGQ